MFYDPRDTAHGLANDPFKSLVVPRPIGWISTLDAEGRVNLAPYSFFNAISADPHYVMFSSDGMKDSWRNVETTGEFVCSMATYDLREQMNKTSAPLPSEEDEMAYAGLTPVPSHNVRPPRVGESPVALECRHHQTVRLPGQNGEEGRYGVVIGEVVGIYIDDAVLVDGRVDVPAIRPVARLGYMDYAVVDAVFTMRRP